jgi:acetyl esterase/lipase
MEDRSVLTREAPPPDRVLAYGEQPEQVIDLRVPRQRGSAPRPPVLLIHGGFWRPRIDRGHTGPMAAELAAQGWTALSAEYRRVPGEPDLAVRDLCRIIEQLPELLDTPCERVLVIGHSAGGHLALCLAAAGLSRLGGILALAPVADLHLAEERALGEGAVRAFLGGSAESRPDLDPARMSAPLVATTIIHGTDDAIVPVEIAESYASAHAQVRLVRQVGAGHFAVIDPLSRAWPAVVRELRRLASRDTL